MSLNEPSRSQPEPVLPLDYLGTTRSEPAGWEWLARCRSVSQWHDFRQALAHLNIDARMGDPGEEAGGEVDLVVQSGELTLATAVVDGLRQGRLWCPYCNTSSARLVPAAWYWYLISVLFLGLSPLWPASKRCERCGVAWG